VHIKMAQSQWLVCHVKVDKAVVDAKAIYHERTIHLLLPTAWLHVFLQSIECV
jgi:hypothetical protein